MNAVPLLALGVVYLAAGASLAPAFLGAPRNTVRGLELALALVFPCVGIAAIVFGLLVLRDREPIGGSGWPGFAATLLALVPARRPVRAVPRPHAAAHRAGPRTRRGPSARRDHDRGGVARDRRASGVERTHGVRRAHAHRRGRCRGLRRRRDRPRRRRLVVPRRSPRPGERAFRSRKRVSRRGGVRGLRRPGVATGQRAARRGDRSAEPRVCPADRRPTRDRSARRRGDEQAARVLRRRPGRAPGARGGSRSRDRKVGRLGRRPRVDRRRARRSDEDRLQPRRGARACGRRRGGSAACGTLLRPAGRARRRDVGEGAVARRGARADRRPEPRPPRGLQSRDAGSLDRRALRRRHGTGARGRRAWWAPGPAGARLSVGPRDPDHRLRPAHRRARGPPERPGSVAFRRRCVPPGGRAGARARSRHGAAARGSRASPVAADRSLARGADADGRARVPGSPRGARERGRAAARRGCCGLLALRRAPAHARVSCRARPARKRDGPRDLPRRDARRSDRGAATGSEAQLRADGAATSRRRAIASSKT